MATQDDVRRLALALPEVTEGDGQFAFGVLNRGKAKGICWVWMHKPEPKGPRVAEHSVLAVRVSGEAEKQELIAADPEKFFTVPHYNGFPAVLVRLAAIDADELGELLTDAWRIQAPRTLVKQFDG